MPEGLIKSGFLAFCIFLGLLSLNYEHMKSKVDKGKFTGFEPHDYLIPPWFS